MKIFDQKTDLVHSCAELVMGVKAAKTYPVSTYVDEMLYKHSQHSKVCTCVLNICSPQ